MTYQPEALLALGDPTRLAILERLVDRPRAVVELAREFPISRPAVSQHLRVLKDAGLVRVSRQGQRRLYVVHPDGLETLHEFLSELWPVGLQRLKLAVEAGDAG